MSGLDRFGSLPKHIRFRIWKEALKEESQNRRVYLTRCHTRVHPRKDLISPLLAATRESRACAEEFYETVLPVVQRMIPEELAEQTNGYNLMTRYSRHLPVNDDHTKPKGCIRVRCGFDLFVIDDPAFLEAKPTAYPDITRTTPWYLLYPVIVTSRLTDDARCRITHMALIHSLRAGLSWVAWSEDRIHQLWRTDDLYPGVSHFFYRLCSDEEYAAIQKYVVADESSAPIDFQLCLWYLVRRLLGERHYIFADDPRLEGPKGGDD